MIHKVLIIAYFFPPIGGSGTQRPAKFVKHLSEFGWQPYVITTDRAYGGGIDGRDETLLADIPADARVWRVPTPEPRPVNRLARWLGWRSSMAQKRSENAESDIVAASPVYRTPMATRVRRTVLSPLYKIQNPPIDPALYWSLRVVPLARRIILDYRIDTILTTVPPWSPLLTGRVLQQLTGCPWVTDFRDPWTDNTLIYFPTRFQHRLNKLLESYLIKRSSAVISVTEPIVAKLRQKVQNGDKKFICIPNGWDRDDISDLAGLNNDLHVPSAPENEILLLHTGSLYETEPLPLLSALERLASEGVDLNGLRFHFIGYLHPADHIAILASPYHKLFRIEVERVSHKEALRKMRASQVLLLFRKNHDDAPGKIFEYMVMGKPVLAIVAKDSVAAQVVQKCGIGCSIDANDVDGLANTLRQIVTRYADFVDQYYRPNWEIINGFERRSLTGQLASLLDTLISQPERQEARRTI